MLIGNGAQTYGFFTIDTNSPGSTESALVHIRVPFAWYEQNELDLTTTIATHCGDNSTVWEVLDVVSSSEDGGYYYFTVMTPGFSEFSVAALPFEMAVEFPVDEEAIADVDHTDEVVESRIKSSMWFIPVIAGILGILFIIIWKRRKDEDE
ncbi:PGF-pre-PGF domain-containing protein [Methanococcoides alaskense]|uniref:Uncharacterized protein n=1 Tax=Methanococcoides alaskense TaxID=325778 RepID=A0AA90U0X8_9EURY|nr:PGF-pre-PGF domain-containing protein [Methanococcoides alaskense]MDA0524440.1 PGF-pre-PGF domain-containing protein [Methanococcoides alaskense]MDR6223258.1 hypothetical protein [Methanococcoides alaskense]